MALMAAAVGGAAFRVFEADPPLLIVTTQFTLAEAKRNLPSLIGRYEAEASTVYEMLEALPVTVYSSADYVSHLAEASRLLQGRDRDDVELLALALKLNVPVWSNDLHFAGLPVEAYPTAVLLKVLGIRQSGTAYQITWKSTDVIHGVGGLSQLGILNCNLISASSPCTANFTPTASQIGSYVYSCSQTSCGSGHNSMKGTIVIQ